MPTRPLSSIDLHADLAKIQAARMADEMLEKGNKEGQRVWLQIRQAVADLTEPANSELN